MPTENDRAATARPTPGRLVLIGTPIGNLGDLSPRAVAALAGADVIACEDTRVTRKLLSHAGITGRRLVAVHAHNEAEGGAALVAEAANGAVVALVTDAGMPAISDPGARVVAAAAAAGVEVVVVPGPSSALAALVVSGLPADRFCFEGFLPRKGGERAARLAAIAAEACTVVLFESPHRVAKLLHDLASVCGEGRPVVVARELTKLHEEVWRGTLGDATAWLDGVEPRGEYVVVLGPRPAAPPSDPVADEVIAAALREHREAGDDRKAALAAVVSSLGVPRRRVYDVAVRLSKSGGDQQGAR